MKREWIVRRALAREKQEEGDEKEKQKSGLGAVSVLGEVSLKSQQREDEEMGGATCFH